MSKITHLTLPDPSDTLGSTLVTPVVSEHHEPGWNTLESIIWVRVPYVFEAIKGEPVMYEQWKPKVWERRFFRPMVGNRLCRCTECKRVHGKSKRSSKPKKIIWEAPIGKA